MCRINPRIDFVFKKLFGSEENKDILIDFINAIVSEKDRVKEVILKNPYNLKSFQNDKSSAVDIKAQDEKGNWFNIEMQIVDQHDFEKRTMYYWSKIYSDQLLTGKLYYKLTKTITINILNFNILEEPEYHNVYKIRNEKSNSLFFDDFELHFIELSKYDAALSSLMDRWVNFLANAGVYTISDLPSELTEISTISKAFDNLERMFFDEAERELYESKLKYFRDEFSRVRYGELKGMSEGMEAGMELGKEIGIEIGREEGIAKGIAKEKRQTAIKLKSISTPLATIVEITGLSAEEIEEL